jgi:hypothetical protein
VNSSTTAEDDDPFFPQSGQCFAERKVIVRIKALMDRELDYRYISARIHEPKGDPRPMVKPPACIDFTRDTSILEELLNMACKIWAPWCRVMDTVEFIRKTIKIVNRFRRFAGIYGWFSGIPVR